LFDLNQKTLKTKSGQGFREFSLLHHVAQHPTIFKTEVTPELTPNTPTLADPTDCLALYISTGKR